MLINEILQLATLELPNQTGGNLGTAATTVDMYSHIRITQTTGTIAAPITIGLFAPTNPVVGQLMYLSSAAASTGYIAIAGVTINPGSFITLIYGTTWQLQSPPAFSNTIDITGTITTRQGSVTTISNSAATQAITGAQVDATSLIKIIQTVTNAAITIANPVTSTAAGIFLRLHNDNTSTFNITFGGKVAFPGEYIDLQWNGNIWATEAETGTLPQSTTVANNTPVATTATVAGTSTSVMQRLAVPAGTYGVFFSVPMSNTATSSIGINLVAAVTVNGANAAYPASGLSTVFIPATGWNANYPVGLSGYTEVTLTSVSSVEVRISHYGTVLTGSVNTIGTPKMRLIKL